MACRRVGVSACRRVGVSACRRVTPKEYQNLAQGGGFAEPWVGLFMLVSPHKEHGGVSVKFTAEVGLMQRSESVGSPSGEQRRRGV